MRRDFLRDFVAFEHMLQGADFETVIVGDMQEHQNFILPVAVGMDQTLAFEHFDQGFEFQIARGRDGDFAARDFRVVFGPVTPCRLWRR